MFSVLALTLKKTAEDDKFLTMISGLWVIFLKEKFSLQKYLFNRCYWRIMKLSGEFNG